MKPAPPDQERVELVISGDDPESHRAAQETARILAAPQIARIIQKRIDECRKKIDAVIFLLQETHSHQDYQLSHCIPQGTNPIHPDIWVAFMDLILSFYADGGGFGGGYKLTDKGKKSRDKLHALLPQRLVELQSEIKQYETQIDDLLALVRRKS